MAIYYHGTNENSARAIEAEGFRGSELSDFTDGFSHVDDGVVFLADDIELARGYGEVIIVVDTERAIHFQNCPVTGKPEFYATVADLEEEGAWWIEGE